MAKIDCPECGESVRTTDASCPYCGAPADRIRKAAAGLEALVTLGDVVHDRSVEEDDPEAMQLRYVRLKKELTDLRDSFVRASTDDESDMVLRMIEKRERQIMDMEFNMGFHGVDQLSPRQQRKLRRELGLDD